MKTTLENPPQNPSPALTIRRASDGRLTVSRDGKTETVTVHPCFPWSRTTEFISLRNAKDQEVALVRQLGDLDQESRAALEAALLESRFTLVIEKIHSIEKDFELRAWQVETAQGPRLFQTKLGEWPYELPDGGVVIRDLAGDLYYVPDPEALDRKSVNLLWAYLE